MHQESATLFLLVPIATRYDEGTLELYELLELLELLEQQENQIQPVIVSPRLSYTAHLESLAL